MRFPKVGESSDSQLNHYFAPSSIRNAGFSEVFVHDLGLRPEDCGGPVVNLQGEIVGLNIAQADRVRTLAIPCDRLRELVNKLIASAGDVGAAEKRE